MKIVLAYSGGLDTSVILQWLKENYQAEIIAFAADVGQGEELKGLKKKALATGASKIYVDDLQEEFARDFIFPMMRASAIYEGQYFLGTSIARPLIAKRMVEIAAAEGATAIAHGATGKGNDQVRFEVSYAALQPDLEVIAPAREWGMTREEEIDYANERGIPVPVGKKSPYSTDTNMWGRSIECGVIEDPSLEAPDDAWEWTVSPMEAPDDPRYVTVRFEAGVPVALDGQAMGGVELVSALNAIGGEHGVGRVNMMENRLVGIKSRELYECPAATILLEAHRDLESLVLDRETMHFKQHLELKYSEMVYYGLWFTPLRLALDAFMKQTQQPVSGDVTVKLFKGKAEAVARQSEQSLYDLSLATYGDQDIFDQSSSRGFIELFGLPAKVVSMVRGLQS